MNIGSVEAIARAVLYEGYILYPYRPSNVKNRRRWTFGAIFPRDWTRRHEDDACRMETQCLLRGGPAAKLETRVRFLQLARREVGELEVPAASLPPDREPAFRKVPFLRIDDRQFFPWDEAIERDVAVDALSVGRLAKRPVRIPFSFEGARQLDPINAPDGSVAGVLLRESSPLKGEITLAARPVARRVFRVSAGIENLTSLSAPSSVSREDAQVSSFASTHTILGVQGGAFVSLLDPPDELREAAACCQNQGTWPVLAGADGRRDMMLSSPIILYDYPEVAPESAGDLYDGAEIDEILTLRILAMTDEEKREMASADAHARALLERTEALTPGELARLHGAFREPRGGAFQPDLRVGDRVRLHPKAGGDAMDLMLKGQAAVIEAIERDFEDRVHVAVVLEDDPGRELGLERMPGHRFFFSPDEIETIAGEGGS